MSAGSEGSGAGYLLVFTGPSTYKEIEGDPKPTVVPSRARRSYDGRVRFQLSRHSRTARAKVT